MYASIQCTRIPLLLVPVCNIHVRAFPLLTTSRLLSSPFIVVVDVYNTMNKQWLRHAEGLYCIYPQTNSLYWPAKERESSRDANTRRPVPLVWYMSALPTEPQPFRSNNAYHTEACMKMPSALRARLLAYTYRREYSPSCGSSASFQTSFSSSSYCCCYSSHRRAPLSSSAKGRKRETIHAKSR